MKDKEQAKKAVVEVIEKSKHTGRPSSYFPEYCEMLIKHMSEGYSFSSFGAVIGATDAMLYDWAKTYPDFAKAKEHGVIMSKHFWETLLIRSARFGVGNLSAISFAMCNRFGYSTKPKEADQLKTRAPRLLSYDLNQLKKAKDGRSK